MKYNASTIKNARERENPRIKGLGFIGFSALLTKSELQRKAKYQTQLIYSCNITSCML